MWGSALMDKRLASASAWTSRPRVRLWALPDRLVGRPWPTAVSAQRTWCWTTGRRSSRAWPGSRPGARWGSPHPPVLRGAFEAVVAGADRRIRGPGVPPDDRREPDVLRLSAGPARMVRRGLRGGARRSDRCGGRRHPAYGGGARRGLSPGAVPADPGPHPRRAGQPRDRGNRGRRGESMGAFDVLETWPRGPGGCSRGRAERDEEGRRSVVVRRVTGLSQRTAAANRCVTVAGTAVPAGRRRVPARSAR